MSVHKAVAAILLLWPLTAHALVLCTMPDGKTYAGDTPPPGCTVKSQYANPAPAPSAPSEGPKQREAKSSAADPNSNEAGQARAVEACKKGLREKLRAPESATFLEPLEASQQGGWNFKVTGDFDLPTTRVHFTCDASYVGGDEWKTTFQLPPGVGPAEAPNPAQVKAAMAAEIARRRSIQAVAVQQMFNKVYSNGRFIEGTVANGADFPVYSVRICFEQGQHCTLIAPSTLQPGAQGTYSYPIARDGFPDWKVTWDVVPPE